MLSFIGSGLRNGQRESVVKIVGKKLEEGPVDFGGFVPVPGSLMITSLNQKAFRARQVGRKFEGLLRLNFGIFVIAELRPTVSQRRVRKPASRSLPYARLQLRRPPQCSRQFASTPRGPVCPGPGAQVPSSGAKRSPRESRAHVRRP